MSIKENQSFVLIHIQRNTAHSQLKTACHVPLIQAKAIFVAALTNSISQSWHYKTSNLQSSKKKKITENTQEHTIFTTQKPAIRKSISSFPQNLKLSSTSHIPQSNTSNPRHTNCTQNHSATHIKTQHHESSSETGFSRWCSSILTEKPMCSWVIS